MKKIKDLARPDSKNELPKKYYYNIVAVELPN